jgi:hypothetical protein
LEIGVDQGKSFILFCLHDKVEKVVGIDLFDLQGENVDKSGFGRLEGLEKNLIQLHIPKEKIELRMGNSTDYKIKNSIKQRDFTVVHIDGGHSLDVVRSDLDLAKKAINDSGVLIVDDFLRPDWPEVSQALFDWLKENQSFKIFCIGHNKAFISKSSFTDKYIEFLQGNERLMLFLRKYYEVNEIRVPIFYHFTLPEWTLKVRIYEYLRLNHPILFVWFKLSRFSKKD